jgi:hypothetical protein
LHSKNWVVVGSAEADANSLLTYQTTLPNSPQYFFRLESD